MKKDYQNTKNEVTKMKRNRQMKTNLELHMNVLCSWHNDLDSKTKETYMYIKRKKNIWLENLKYVFLEI